MLKSVRDMVQTKSFGFLSYNDQPPGSNSGPEYGHSKGVVMGDSSTKSALWLTHNTPKFPTSERNKNHFWKDNIYKKGQTFMCVTLGYNDLDTVVKHLQNIRAYVFDDHHFPGDFHEELKDAIEKKEDVSYRGKPQDLKTKGGEELKTLAKNTGKTAKVGDLYVQLAEHLKSDMKAQTWGCQKGRDKSFCGEPYKVFNIEGVRTDIGDWNRTKDHSKWAITTEITSTGPASQIPIEVHHSTNGPEELCASTTKKSKNTLKSS
ncbi:plancitoxin-1-like [Boleophthalmus pectinirostris]|uniref:plancitoxin-1-like n=1 Tax=Boleophthalmus pectinirostris TaxID=150288 RepID=UPI00242B772C|nr:plancitoxin-1-like [Boleophthalmus pectinirostris]